MNTIRIRLDSTKEYETLDVIIVFGSVCLYVCVWIIAVSNMRVLLNPTSAGEALTKR